MSRVKKIKEPVVLAEPKPPLEWKKDPPVLPTLPPIIEKPFVAEIAAPVVPPCVLDGAPVNSKIVVVLENGKKTPIFMTPQGVAPIEASDVAWTLTNGAKVNKVSDSKFVAVQLDHNRAVAPLWGTSARDVIQRFHKHFHG